MDISNNQIVKSSCRICYNNCGVLIHIENGNPIKIEGDPQNPMNKGKLCQKGYASLEFLNHPDRLKHPLIRDGEKGSGKWKTVSWDEALETVADQLKRVSDAYGKESVVFLRGASKGRSDDFHSCFSPPSIDRFDIDFRLR